MMAAPLSPTALGTSASDLMAHDLQRQQIHEMTKLVDQIVAQPDVVEHTNLSRMPTDLAGQRWDITVTTIARRVA